MYDKLRAELHERGTCAAAWAKSAEVCGVAYKVTPFDADDHAGLLRRYAGAKLSEGQHAAHRALYAWRDKAAQRVGRGAHLSCRQRTMHRAGSSGGSRLASAAPRSTSAASTPP